MRISKSVVVVAAGVGSVLFLASSSVKSQPGIIPVQPVEAVVFFCVAAYCPPNCSCNGGCTCGAGNPCVQADCTNAGGFNGCSTCCSIHFPAGVGGCVGDCQAAY